MAPKASSKLVGVEGSQANTLPLKGREEASTAPDHFHTSPPQSSSKKRYSHSRRKKKAAARNAGDGEHSAIQSENIVQPRAQPIKLESSTSANLAHTQQPSLNSAAASGQATKQTKKRARRKNRSARRGEEDKASQPAKSAMPIQSHSSMMPQSDLPLRSNMAHRPHLDRQDAEEDIGKGKQVDRTQQGNQTQLGQQAQVERLTPGVSTSEQMAPASIHQRLAKLKQVGPEPQDHEATVKSADQIKDDDEEEKQEFGELPDENFDSGATSISVRELPTVTRSLPSTPDTVTFDEWKKLPVWQRYAPLTYKEKLAIKAIEAIPKYILTLPPDHTVTTPTDLVSPRLVPFIDRMAFIFARVMAKARLEAENGQFTMGMTTTSPPDQSRPDLHDGNKHAKKDDDIQSVDVMSSRQVEVFCAGMQEVRDPDRDNRVVMRRYWRITEGLENCDMVGGVIAACSKEPVHMSAGFKAQAKKGGVDGVLLAEVDVKKDGTMISGEWNAIGLGLSESF